MGGVGLGGGGQGGCERRIEFFVKIQKKKIGGGVRSGGGGGREGVGSGGGQEWGAVWLVGGVRVDVNAM